MGWVKSSQSMSNGQCVEAGWVKSSLSFSNGNCVEVTQLPENYVGVRNSRHPDGAVLTFTPEEWSAFIAGAKKGEFDKFGVQPGIDVDDFIDGARKLQDAG